MFNEELLKRAESGDAEAALEVANCYYRGIDVEEDNDKALTKNSNCEIMNIYKILANGIFQEKQKRKDDLFHLEAKNARCNCWRHCWIHL